MVTRDAAIVVLSAVTCAPITRTIRAIRSEVTVGADEGLPEASVITCDNLVTLPKSMFDPSPVGHLNLERRAALDQAFRCALEIQH